MSVWDDSPLPPPPADGPPAAPPPDGPPPTPAGGHGDDVPPSGRSKTPVWLLVGLGVALVLAVVVVLALVSGDEPRTADVADPAAATSAPTPPPTTFATGPAAVTSAPTTTAPTTAVATTAVPPSTVPETAAPTTSTLPATTTTSTLPTTTTTSTLPATTATTTTTTTTTLAEAAPTTSVAAAAITISDPSTVTGDDGRTLSVTPRIGPCSSGPECFIASFTVDGFPTPPQEFVCEFSSGARYVFRVAGSGADPACSTQDVPDSIVIEVDGLRSEPVTISR